VLSELRVQNLAILPESKITFGKGLNILTGETGAGKSILLEAIALLGGRRSSVDDVRSGEKMAVIEGVLSFNAKHGVWSFLEDNTITGDVCLFPHFLMG